MRKVLIHLLLIVFMLSLLSSSTFATDVPKFSARVEVDITADDSMKGLITSYINRELRSLHDVKIVDDEPEWIIQIVAVEVKIEGSHQAGVALSVVVLEPFDNRIMDTMVRGLEVEKDTMLLLKNTTIGLYGLPGQMIRVGPTDDLQTLCKNIVATFDTKSLEIRRKLFREFTKKAEESKAK